MALPFGTVLHGKYRVEQTLGQGGFGITYKAIHLSLKQYVAIKEYFPEMALRVAGSTQVTWKSSDKSSIVTVTAEAQAIARFNYPGIVRVFDVFEENNTAYVVMELLQGMNLEERIAQAPPLSNQEVIDIGIKVAEALSVVHQENLLHRDLKPANVFLAKNRVVLIDFGSAREFIQGKTVGHTRVLSPGYAPLEQYATAAKLGPYTDIYALAATLYHALSGNPPPDALNRTQGVAVPPLPHSTPKHLRDLIMRSLETDTAKRPQTTEEWIRLLQAVSTPGPTPEEWIRRLQAVSTPSPTPPAPSPQPVPPAPQPAPSPTHVAVPMEFDRRNGAYKRDRQGMYLIYLLSIPAYTAITYFFIDNLIFSLLISFSVAFAIFNNLPLWKPQPYTKYYPHRNHVAPASVVAKGTKYLAWVETTKGNFTIELSTSTAPNAVNSFVYLALSRYYEDMSWYRVVPRMLAQTGDPTNTGNGGPGYQIPHEITPNSRNNEEGIVAMARVSDVSSNGGQFIVTLTPIADFDKQHTVIGKVTAGLHVVKSLAATEGPQGVSGHQRDRIVSVVIAKPVSIFQS